MDAGSAAVLGIRATANTVCANWLVHRDEVFGRCGGPRADTYPACARHKFGDGLLNEVRCAADIPAGLAGNRGKFPAFAPDADIPASSCEGALEALGGQ